MFEEKCIFGEALSATTAPCNSSTVRNRCASVPDEAPLEPCTSSNSWLHINYVGLHDNRAEQFVDHSHWESNIITNWQKTTVMVPRLSALHHQCNAAASTHQPLTLAQQYTNWLNVTVMVPRLAWSKAANVRAPVCKPRATGIVHSVLQRFQMSSAYCIIKQLEHASSEQKAETQEWSKYEN